MEASVGNAPTNDCFADSAVHLLGQKSLIKMVGRTGFEPMTTAIQMPHSDQTELPPVYKKWHFYMAPPHEF